MVGQCLTSAEPLDYGSAAHLSHDSALVSSTGLDLALLSEQWLGQLAEELATCVTAALEPGQTALDGTSPWQTAAFQALTKTIGQAFDKAIVAIALAQTTKSGETDFIISQRVAPPAWQICGDGTHMAIAAENALELGQTFSTREICQLQMLTNLEAWQILAGEQLIGWLLIRWLPSAPIGQASNGNLPFQTRCSLLRQLVERAIAQTVVTIRQIHLIQAQHQQQADLIAQNRELAQANQFKGEFLANTSHEIRTPLSSILGFTHLLREQGFDPTNARHHEYLNIILTSGQHLLALINDILDLSKIEANQLDLTWEAIEIQAVCRMVLALVKEKAQTKGLNLQFEISPTAHDLVADSLRLKQMLFNLLSNSIKFTQQGSVGLQVTATATDIHFTVWDTGIGIALEKQALLFRPYAQIRNEAVNDSEGTGLGLALTQKLAELQGGKVELVSAVNQGSRFTICLPKLPAIAESAKVSGSNSAAALHDCPAHAQSVALKAVKPDPCPPTLGLRQLTEPLPANNAIDKVILLVEDNPLNARLIKTYLGKLGYQVGLAQDGTEMWEALERSRPALILMDVCLPIVDGLTLIQQLRTDHRYQTIPVIAQTAMAMTGDRETCLAAGANGYLSKPIDLEVLAHEVAQYLSQ